MASVLFQQARKIRHRFQILLLPDVAPDYAAARRHELGVRNLMRKVLMLGELMRTVAKKALAVRCALILGLAFFATTNPLIAQEVNFSGKTVRMIVGSNAGGVTDVGARLVARYMSKYLPGSPHIVPQNMPGANGITAANYLYQQVEPDGLTSLAGSSSQVTPDVIRANPSVRYDLTKFAWIGGLYNEGTLVVASRPAIARLNSRTSDPVVMGQVGGARTEALVAVWAAEYLGWKVRFVTGYPGTPQIVIAMLSGEVEMMNSSGLAGLDQILKELKKFGIVMQTGVYNNGKFAPRPGFGNTPLISEALQGSKISGSAKRAFDSWLDSIQIGKYFALPPKTPASFQAAYRDAFSKMVADPEFQAQAPAAFEPGYVMMSGDEVKTLIDRMGATPEDDYKYVDRLREKYGLASERRGSN